jgi:hypothetical protein
MKWFWQSPKTDEEKERLRVERDTWKQMYSDLALRDMESERTRSLEAQCHILGERAKMHDHMMGESRKLRSVVKEIWPRDLEIAEETNLPLVDLVIWLIRGKPGPEMPKASGSVREEEIQC